ncbi:hypothetical protein [Roseococcus sp. YIM B11640]|uniref:hypothetical protein n=1 Tax=Roseococcus sp. YIM B11640 TaxID=3133973 RepID=UPI003C79E481
MRGAFVLLAMLPLLGACATAQRPTISDNFCAARLDRAARDVPQPRPGQTVALTRAGFDADALETAEIIGALDPVADILEAERRADGGTALLLARQGLTHRVLLAMLDVNATLAAIDCEGERGDQLRGQLQRIEARRTRNLGLAGILIGAATAAASGGLSMAGSSNAGDIAGVVGGAAEAMVGGAILFGSSTGRLSTRANLLNEVFRQPANSSLFPPTVWRYLTRRDTPDSRSIAEEIVAEWRSAGLIDEDDIEPLFDPEGEFSVGDMERRDAMLDLLEARIALMSRDLRLLLEEVVYRPVPERVVPRRRR